MGCRLGDLVIYWQSENRARSYVAYGTTKACAQRTPLSPISAVTGQPFWSHFHRLTGLKPDTRYFFRMVCLGTDGKEVSSPIRSFEGKPVEVAYNRIIGLGEQVEALAAELEAAKALRLAGAQVQVVEASEYVLSRQLDPPASRRLADALTREGLSFHLGRSVEAFLGGDTATGIRLDNGVELFADLVLLAVGVEPDTHLARLAGCEVERGVLVDDHLATSVDDIYAAGDVAQHAGKVYGIWPAALEQGRAAGRNAAGAVESYAGTVSFNPLKVVDTPAFSVGVIAAETSADRELLLETDRFYKKLVLRDGVLVGAVMVGDTTESGALTTAVAERLDVSHAAAAGDPAAVLAAVVDFAAERSVFPPA